MATPTDHRASDEVWNQPLRLGLALSAITVGQLISSFGIQWYTVALLGVGVETDALYAGSTVPQVIMLVLIESLGFVLVPMLAVRPEGERRVLGWLLFGLTTLLCIAIAVLLLLLIPVVVPWLVPGFSSGGLQLTMDLAKIQTGGIVGAGCVVVLSSLYQARQKFLWPAVSVLVSTLAGWLVLIVGLRSEGVGLAAWVQVLNQSAPILFLALCLGRIPRKRNLQISVILSELWRRLLPLFASSAYYRTGFVVDRFLTSLLTPGSVVILDLALRLHAAVVRIVNQGATTPLVPPLATLSAQGSWDAFNKLYRERLRWVALISLASVLGLGAVTLQTHVLYVEHGDLRIVGALQMRDLDHLVMALMASSGALLCGSMNHLFVSTFYALGQTSAPAKIQMVTYSVGLILKFFGFVFGGLVGIAVAISLSYGLEGVFLGAALHRRLKWRAASAAKPPLEMPAAGLPPRRF